MQQTSDISAPSLGHVIREAREQLDLTIRELGRVAGISHTQLGRIESGKVQTPSKEMLATIAKALDRNPLPLLILGGHLSDEEARIALEPMFRDGAELPEEWGEWASVSLGEARDVLRTPSADDHELRRLAADVFSVAETDETLWDESHTLLLAQGDPDLLRLAGIWRFVRGARRKQLLAYAETLRQLEDLEYLAETEQLRLAAATPMETPSATQTPLDRADLEARGFKGFVRVRDLPRGCPTVPAQPGIYVALRPGSGEAELLEASVGGHFKGQDPAVAREDLLANWVDGAAVLYIGRGGDLRKRLDLLARFSRGEPVGHWGGRLLWQLGDHDKLLVAWLETTDPVNDEADLIDEFTDAHGALPFANLNRPGGARKVTRAPARARNGGRLLS